MLGEEKERKNAEIGIFSYILDHPALPLLILRENDFLSQYLNILSSTFYQDEIEII